MQFDIRNSIPLFCNLILFIHLSVTICALSNKGYICKSIQWNFVYILFKTDEPPMVIFKVLVAVYTILKCSVLNVKLEFVHERSGSNGREIHAHTRC